MKITIKDISKKCDVSISTVSRALCDSESISPETKQRIHDMAKKMGYTRTPKAIKNTRGEIALVVPSLSGYMFGPLISEISDILSENYDLRVVKVDARHVKPLDIDYLVADKICGIVFFGCFIEADVAQILKEASIPSVSLFGKSCAISSFCINNYSGIKDACDYLIARGCKKIGFVAWEPIDNNVTERMNSFRSTMLGYELDASHIVLKQLDIESGYQATEELLANEKLDGIVFAADIMALGGYLYMESKGLSIHKDVIFIGFDNSPYAKIINLPTMDLILSEITSLGLDRLQRMLESEELLEPIEMQLSPKLFENNG